METKSFSLLKTKHFVITKMKYEVKTIHFNYSPSNILL